MGAADTAKLIASLELRDKQFQQAVSRATGSVDTLEKRLGRIGSTASRGLKSAGQNIERGIVIGVTAAGAALGYAVKQAVDWESAVAGVNKTIDATPAQLKEITDGLIAMSNRMPVSAQELAAIAEAAGALGIAKEDILSFTETVAILGATTNVTTEEAATALGQLSNVIGLTGEDYDNFAASLVDLGNKGASTEAQILAIARRSGGAAKLIGVAKDATLGWASAAANLGLEEELAGTSLQNFFIKSQNLIANGGKNLDAFAKISGQTAAEFKKNFDQDATGALEAFLAGLGKLPKDQRLKAVQKMFGKGSGLTRLILGLSESVDRNLTPALDTSTEAWKANAAAAAEAEKRFKTSASLMSTLRNNVDNAAASIGTALLPVLNELAQEGAAWLADPATQAGIKTFSKDLAAGARDAVTWLKSLDWNAIAGALKAGAGFAKGLIDAFANAPPWVQQFLTVGFVANKFTGGAIGDIIGEVGKGLIKGVLGMNAGVVNLKAAVVNGGVGAGAAAGAAGKASKIGAVAAAIGKVFIIGAAVGVFAELKGALDELSASNRLQAAGIVTQTQKFTGGASLAQLKQSLAGVDAQIFDLNSGITAQGTAFALNIDGVKDSIYATRQSLVDAIAREEAEAATRTVAATERAEARASQVATAAASRITAWLGLGVAATQRGVDATQRTVAATERAEATLAQKLSAGTAATISTSATEAAYIRIAGQTTAAAALQAGRGTQAATAAVRSAVANVASVTAGAGARTAAAIRNKDLSVKVINNVRAVFSTRDNLITVAKTNAYGAVVS